MEEEEEEEEGRNAIWRTKALSAPSFQLASLFLRVCVCVVGTLFSVRLSSSPLIPAPPGILQREKNMWETEHEILFLYVTVPRVVRPV